jgi:hydrogenase nickel incorporation protein HypB
MCMTCGCGNSAESNILIAKPGEVNPENISLAKETSHQHSHHEHTHEHGHHHTHTKTLVEMEQDILQSNNLTAERNRGFFEAKNIFALNLVSSPGSGKTSFLEKTLQDMKNTFPFYVIEGDQQTFQDAQRIEKQGVPVVQINTGQGCHLDSSMINKALKTLRPEENAVVMIENVGNLVCPALFDLGEHSRIVIISVTEGDDKPIKYPDMFQSADLCIINKIDLLPYVNFDVQKAKDFALRVNHHLTFFEVSATTGEGMTNWYQWLKKRKNKPQD